VEVHPTDPFAELVLHVLAHIRAPGPLDLFDARYVEWAAARTPEMSRVRVQPDAQLLAGAWCEPDAPLVQRWVDLHFDLASFVRTKERALAELGPDDVEDPALLERLQGLSPLFTELFHAQLGLVVHWFAGLHAVHIAPALASAARAVADHAAAAIELVPALADARIEVAWALGPHARASRQRIIVGAPASWNDVDAPTAVVLALHGDALRRAHAADPVRAQWLALREVCTTLARGSIATAALREAHLRWLAALDLAPMCRVLVSAGEISAADADALFDWPTERADVMRRLA
jgi:hypothetical protein